MQTQLSTFQSTLRIAFCSSRHVHLNDGSNASMFFDELRILRKF